MTHYEPTPDKYTTGSDVIHLRAKDDKVLGTGTITGVSDESVWITWDSCKEEVEYSKSDMPKLYIL